MREFERLRIHPDRPQLRQIRRAVACLQAGGCVVMPTDATYVLVCRPESNSAIAAIRQLRRLDRSHYWSLICSDLSQAARYVRIDNQAHRLLKRCLPGAYTCILPACSALPKRIFGKRHDVGVRIPNHPVCAMLLAEHGEALLCTTLQLPDEELPAYDPDLFVAKLHGLHAVLLDAGWGGMEPTTVLDLCDGLPLLVRQGAGVWPC